MARAALDSRDHHARASEVRAGPDRRHINRAASRRACRLGDAHGVYAGIVVGIGTLAGDGGGPVLTVAAAVTIAVLFQPVRAAGPARSPTAAATGAGHAVPGARRLRRGHGRAAGLRHGTRPDGVDPGRATGAVRVEVWIRVGAQLRPQVTWPRGSAPPAAVPLAGDAELPAFELATRAVAVRHGDELLGALTIQKPRNEPVTAAEDKLLAHLGVAGGPGPAQRPAHRRAAGHDRRPAGVTAAAGRGPG